jgi:hypothetical protein
MATNGRRTGRPSTKSTERSMRNTTGSSRRKRRTVRGCRRSSRAPATRSLTVTMRLPSKALLRASSVYIAGFKQANLTNKGSFAPDIRARVASCDETSSLSCHQVKRRARRETSISEIYGCGRLELHHILCIYLRGYSISSAVTDRKKIRLAST